MDRRILTRYAGALAAVGVFGYYAFQQNTRVPLIWRFDLGMHELGHMVGYILPVSQTVAFVMGSLTQVLVPLGLGVYFAWGKADRVAGGVCLAWSASNLQDASIYIGDAPYERLQLIGGMHDWAYILGAEQLDRLDRATAYASQTRTLGLFFVVAAVVVIVADLAFEVREPTPLELGSERPKTITTLDWGTFE